MGRPALDDHAVGGLGALFGRQLQQRLGDPAGHVEQGQALDLAVGFAQARGQFGQERGGDLRRLVYQLDEIGTPQHQQISVLGGHHIGRARLAIEQRQLAEDRARAQKREDDLTPFLADDTDLDLALLEDEERVAILLGENDDTVLAKGAGEGQIR